jgi:hypothetical protein
MTSSGLPNVWQSSTIKNSDLQRSAGTGPGTMAATSPAMAMVSKLVCVKAHDLQSSDVQHLEEDGREHLEQ